MCDESVRTKVLYAEKHCAHCDQLLNNDFQTSITVKAIRKLDGIKAAEAKYIDVYPLIELSN